MSHTRTCSISWVPKMLTLRIIHFETGDWRILFWIICPPEGKKKTRQSCQEFLQAVYPVWTQSRAAHNWQGPSMYNVFAVSFLVVHSPVKLDCKGSSGIWERLWQEGQSPGKYRKTIWKIQLWHREKKIIDVFREIRVNFTSIKQEQDGVWGFGFLFFCLFFIFTKEVKGENQRTGKIFWKLKTREVRNFTKRVRW